jgi:hypothetical protein
VRLGCSGGGVAGATSDVSTCMAPSISDLDARWLKGELSKQRVEMRRGLTGERSGVCGSSPVRVGLLNGVIVHEICEDCANSSGISIDILKLLGVVGAGVCWLCGAGLRGVVGAGVCWFRGADLRGVAGTDFGAGEPMSISSDERC